MTGDIVHIPHLSWVCQVSGTSLCPEASSPACAPPILVAGENVLPGCLHLSGSRFAGRLVMSWPGAPAALGECGVTWTSRGGETGVRDLGRDGGEAGS